MLKQYTFIEKANNKTNKEQLELLLNKFGEYLANLYQEIISNEQISFETSIKGLLQEMTTE